jgi:hypothetical protein
MREQAQRDKIKLGPSTSLVSAALILPHGEAYAYVLLVVRDKVM